MGHRKTRVDTERRDGESVGMLPHLKVGKGQLPECIIIPGAPERAKLIADLLTDSKLISANREYHTFVGKFNGISVAVISAGVGAAGAAIAYEEAIAAGGRVLIRVGTAGSLSEAVNSGDLVVVTAAIRDEGLTRQLLPIEYPAVADLSVISALRRSAAGNAHVVHTGVVLSTEAFYTGRFSLDRDFLAGAGALCVEMECSTLFVVASMHRVRAGAILAVNGDTSKNKELIESAVNEEVTAALNALSTLTDRKK